MPRAPTATPRVTVTSTTAPASARPTSLAAAQAWRTEGRAAALSQFAVLLRHPHQSVALENALLRASRLPYVTAGFDSYLVRPEVLLVRGLLAVATRDFSSIDDPDTRRRIVEAFVFFGDITITDTRQRPRRPRRRCWPMPCGPSPTTPPSCRVFFENQVLRNAAPAVRSASKPRSPWPATIQVTACWPPCSRPCSPANSRRACWWAWGRCGPSRPTSPGCSARPKGHAVRGCVLPEPRTPSSGSSANAAPPTRLVLAQVEAAKGLEYEQVVIPFLRQDTFPDRDTPDDEERNLFYVAITARPAAS